MKQRTRRGPGSTSCVSLPSAASPLFRLDVYGRRYEPESLRRHRCRVTPDGELTPDPLSPEVGNLGHKWDPEHQFGLGPLAEDPLPQRQQIGGTGRQQHSEHETRRPEAPQIGPHLIGE